MKHYLRPVFALAVLLFLTAASVQTVAGEKMVIALKTNNFELAETDISELAIGEAQPLKQRAARSLIFYARRMVQIFMWTASYSK